MDRLYAVADDFEARIRIFTEAEGGRSTPVCNGIRWDFSYATDEDARELFMIWPDFVSASGDSLSQYEPLPLSTFLCARMTVVADEMRALVHRARIFPGVEFFCHEGDRKVAVGCVTRITGLYRDRESQG
ncbi:hypothetical protein [Halopseudomonas sp.]|uniref:hypothetical protein n=1 Tax=Halopseudomonas sp. TaxID=2901191 RepID=UPI00311D9273